MKTYLLRLFLSLYLIFLGGYGQLYAHTSLGSAFHPSTNLHHKLEKASFADAHKAMDLASHLAPSELKTAPFKLKATQEKEEEEERESASFKKHASGSLYFSAFFWAHTLSYFFSFSKGILPFSEHIPFISPASRQLLFQVFRI
ncbi:MAG: hypothetical protein ACO1NZ_05750 [Adhaeribacter sp.]